MRVLYFTEGDSPHDQRFIQALSDTTHQVFVLRQYESLPVLPPGVIELKWISGQPDWSAWRGWVDGKAQFIKLVNQIQPDLVHAGPVQGPALLAALAGFHPLVTMSWGSDLLVSARRNFLMRYFTRLTLKRTDVLLVDCQVVAAEAALYGFPKEKMVLFPWGVDLDHFSAENGLDDGQVIRRSLGWEDMFVIMCNRSWMPIYGVDVLAQGFTLAAQEKSKFRLLLIGDGPETGKIRQILSPNSDSVYLPGKINRELLPGMYCAADIFVSPSHSDGSSVSLLESLACGRPVLVSDIPSNQEWVTPGEVGDCFRDGDVDSLKEKLIQLSEDPLLTQYGKNARALAERRADWQVNFGKLLSAYHLAKKGNQ